MRRRVGSGSLVVATILTLTATACTTSVTGTGRPAAARSSPSAGASSTTTGAAAVPSGAPDPVTTGYPSSTPAERSYLFARDASLGAGTVTAKGTFSRDGVTFTVDGRFGYDAAAQELTGGCLLGTGTVTADVRALGDTITARAPAAFWTTAGIAADAAGQAADRWVLVTDLLGVAAACSSTVLFLSFFEPTGDDLETSTEDGGAAYVVTDRATGYATVVDHDTGRITAIRSAAGTVEVGYAESSAPAGVTLPAAGEIATIPGF